MSRLWAAPLATAAVRGTVTIPGSKSASARSLVLAGLADRPSRLTGLLDSRDTALMREGLTVLGVGFADRPDGSTLVLPAGQPRGGGTIQVGLAGTVMRFLPPVAVLAAEPTTFEGDRQAAARPVAPLLGALADLGAKVSGPHRLPFSVAAGAFRGGTVSLDASASSQFVSALLLAGARYRDGIDVRHSGGTVPSLPHIEMTCTLLRRRGVEVTRTSASSWSVAPGPISACDEVVEPDLTNAATVLAAALVTGGSLSTAWPSDSVQATDALAGVLAAFGARLDYRDDPNGVRVITVSGTDGVHGADVDLHDVSELTPVAAALAAVADSPSRLRGVAHIRGHETDRLAALAEGLSGLGVHTAETPDGLAITPTARHGGMFATRADHRLAHAAALVGLVTPGVMLDDISCTTKTLPDFAALWRGLMDGER